MFRFLRSMSRTVHEEVHHDDQAREEDKIGDGGACTSLTVWRKSLLMSCNGFTVIDSNGNLVYRVDNYRERRPQEVTLMDGTGKPILTMRRRKVNIIFNLSFDVPRNISSSTTKTEPKIEYL